MIDTCRLHDDLEDFATYLGVDYDDYYQMIYNLPDEDVDVEVELTAWWWECVCPKSYTNCSPFFFFIMSTELMVAALRRGKTGDEILTILDAITSDCEYVESPKIEQVLGIQPTLETIEFW